MTPLSPHNPTPGVSAPLGTSPTTRASRPFASASSMKRDSTQAGGPALTLASALVASIRSPTAGALKGTLPRIARLLQISHQDCDFFARVGCDGAWGS